MTSKNPDSKKVFRSNLIPKISTAESLTVKIPLKIGSTTQRKTTISLTTKVWRWIARWQEDWRWKMVSVQKTPRLMPFDRKHLPLGFTIWKNKVGSNITLRLTNFVYSKSSYVKIPAKFGAIFSKISFFTNEKVIFLRLFWFFHYFFTIFFQSTFHQTQNHKHVRIFIFHP